MTTILSTTTPLSEIPERQTGTSHRVDYYSTSALTCKIYIGAGLSVVAQFKDANTIIVDCVSLDCDSGRYNRVVYAEKPFITVQILTPVSVTRQVKIPRNRWSGWYSYTTEHNTYYHYDNNLTESDLTESDYQRFVEALITAEDGTTAVITLNLQSPRFGEVDLVDNKVRTNFFGADLSWPFVMERGTFLKSLRNHTYKQGCEAAWGAFLATQPDPSLRDQSAIKSLETKKTIQPNLQRLETEEPVLWRFFAWLHNGKTQNKTSNNKLLAAMLTLVGENYEALRDELRRVLTEAKTLELGYSSDGFERSVCLTLVGASDRVAEAKAKAQWQYAKGAKAQAEVLGVSAEKHPLLMAAIESNRISLNLFHEAGKDDNLINTEFDLWEKALARPGWSDVLIQIAQNASGRSTYSKRVTSYIAFLFKLERYLDRTASRPKSGKKSMGWKTFPKFVSSQWELEMTDEATEEGTTKRRSAMTPIVDNDAGTVHVPYVAMAVSGIRTTWCYSEIFFVAEEGAEDPIFRAGGVFQSDFEEKLNGRDDYGMCFFTLTGTDQNTGYPTFLIIFERTTKHGTRVHFHRVHPSRTHGPNGTQTPPNRMVQECYRYMAGNIRAEEIAYQQGDLLLQVADGPGKAVEQPVNVLGFENHSFVPNMVDGVSKPVQLVRSNAKGRGNLLGWLHAPTGMRMPHPEHEPVEDIPPGWYALNRCRSYENNPVSVWVLNID